MYVEKLVEVPKVPSPLGGLGLQAVFALGFRGLGV